MESELKSIPVNSIILDDENPRLAFAKIEKEVEKWTSESMTEEIKEIENFKLYRELSKFIKTNKLAIQNPRYYSFFQKASIDTRNRFFTTKKGREQFFKMILPNKYGPPKIPNVAVKGGLIKCFNKFCGNEVILQKFMKTPKMTAEEAYLEHKGGNVQDEFPWIKKLRDIANGMNKLGKEDVAKIKKDKTTFNYIKKIYFASQGFVEKK